MTCQHCSTCTWGTGDHSSRFHSKQSSSPEVPCNSRLTTKRTDNCRIMARTPVATQSYLPCCMLLPACLQIRAELAEKELTLLQKEQELLDKEQTLLVLKEEVSSSAFCVWGSWSAQAMYDLQQSAPTTSTNTHQQKQQTQLLGACCRSFAGESAATTPARRHLLPADVPSADVPLPPPRCVSAAVANSWSWRESCGLCLQKRRSEQRRRQLWLWACAQVVPYSLDAN